MEKAPLYVVESEGKRAAMQELAGPEAEFVLIKRVPCRVETYAEAENGPQRKRYNFRFEADPQVQEVLDGMGELGKREVLIAFDNDRRGAHWGWLIEGYVKSRLPGLQCKPFLLRGLCAAEFAAACKEADKNDFSGAEAAHVRSLFQQLLGRQIHKLLGTKTGPNGLPLHFDSLVALALLQNRENENRMYVPLLQWHLFARCGQPGKDFSAVCRRRATGKESGFENEDQCRQVAQKVLHKTLSITKIDKNKLTIQPPSPFLLADLLQTAYLDLKFSPRETLGCLRKLFASRSPATDSQGLISWFVTGCGLLSDDTLDALDDAVAAQCGDTALSSSLPTIADGAIVPLQPEVSGTDLSGILPDSEARLYEMIRLRALASRMRPASGQSISLTVEGEDFVFQASDQQIEEKGFLSLYQDRKGRELLAPCPFLELSEGDGLFFAETSVEQKCSYPPEPYTFESLFADLSDFAIVDDPSLPLMFQAMLDSGYCMIDASGALVPLENCQKVVAAFNRVFPSMQGVNLFAYLEQTAQEVITGRKALDFALNQFSQTLNLHGKSQVRVSAAALAALQKRRQQKSNSIIREVPSGQQVPVPSLKEVTVEKRQVKEIDSHVLPQEQDVGDIGTAAEAEAVDQQRGTPEQITDVEAAASKEAEDSDMQLSQEEEAEEEMLVKAAEQLWNSNDLIGESRAQQPDSIIEEAEKEREKVFAELPQQESPDEKDEEANVGHLGGAALPEFGETASTKSCPVCSRPMILKSDRFGRFWNCTGFPACRYAEPENKQESERMPCPVCGKGTVLSKTTPTGKFLFVCSEIDCEFMAWSKPHPFQCGVCGSPFLVEKRKRDGSVVLRCPKAGCGHQQQLSGIASASGDLECRGDSSKKRKVRIRRVAAGAASPGRKKKLVRVVRRKA